MTRVPPRLALIVTLIVVLPLAGAAAENDAGSGGDAPDTREGALAVPYGTWTGYLGKDADWYAPGGPSATPVCLTVRVGGDADSDATLEVVGGSGTTTLSGDGNGGDAAVVVASLTSTRLGISPTLNPATNTPARPGTYSASVTARAPGDLGPGDAGTGADVGNDLGHAKPITDACATGAVQATLDPRDVYTFTAAAGNRARLSFLQLTQDGVNRASLVAPDGTTLGVVSNGGMTAFTLPAAGTYQLVVSVPDTLAGGTTRTASTTGGALEEVRYLLAFDLDDPNPTQPCRPTCF